MFCHTDHIYCHFERCHPDRSPLWRRGRVSKRMRLFVSRQLVRTYANGLKIAKRNLYRLNAWFFLSPKSFRRYTFWGPRKSNEVRFSFGREKGHKTSIKHYILQCFAKLCRKHSFCPVSFWGTDRCRENIKNIYFLN